MKKTWAVIGLSLLAACSYFQEDKSLPCPPTGMLQGAGNVTYLQEQKPLVYGKVGVMTGTCMPGKTGGMDFDLGVDFVAARAAGVTDISTQAMPYFIAVLSPSEEVLQRTAFSTSVEFDATGKGVSHEDHRLRLPVSDPAEARKYKVVVGFDLTPEQIKYNREKHGN